MKKTYIVPNAKCIKLAYEGLVALSDGDNTGEDFDANDKSLSNRRSIWGDEN